jgi:hypothetical protein
VERKQRIYSGASQLLLIITCSLTTSKWCRVFTVLVIETIKNPTSSKTPLTSRVVEKPISHQKVHPSSYPSMSYDRGAFAPNPAIAADTDRFALAHDAHNSETPAPAAGTDRCALAHDAHDSETPASANVAHTDSSALARVAHESGALTAGVASALLPDEIHLVLVAATYLESRYRVLLDRAHDQFLLLDLGDIEDPTRMREQLILEFRADPFLDDDVFTVLKMRVSILSIYKV